MERGVVVQVDGGRVLVEAGPDSSCDGCSAARSCLAAASGGGRRIWMDNTMGAATGDEVAFRIQARAVVGSALVLYAVPAVMLVAGILLGSSLSGRLGTDPELSAIAGGVASLIMSCGIILMASSVLKKRRGFIPQLVEVTAKKMN